MYIHVQRQECRLKLKLSQDPEQPVMWQLHLSSLFSKQEESDGVSVRVRGELWPTRETAYAYHSCIWIGKEVMLFLVVKEVMLLLGELW